METGTSRLLAWAVVVGFWTALGVIFSMQIYFLALLRHEATTFWSCFLWQTPPCEVWALATPLVLWLGRRFHVDSRRWTVHLPIHVAAVLGISVVHLTVAIYSGRFAGMPWFSSPLVEVLPGFFARNIGLDLVTYSGVLAAGLARDYYRRARAAELGRAQLETRLAQAQLDALKVQLHPHFLFNTLNAIAMLVRKQDTQGAVRMIAGVSDLLRVALANAGQQLVPLKDELAFIDRYLEIERTRFADRLRIERDIDPTTLAARVPNLILQPVVENAVKHGISARADAGLVRIVARRRDAGRLELQVRDDGPGLPPAPPDDTRSGAGMGLANVRARLACLYPGRHRVAVDEHPEGGVIVTLEMPYDA